MNDVLRQKIKKYSSLIVYYQLLNSDLGAFILTPEDELNRWHFGLGAWIRSRLLTQGSDLYALFLHCGITHKDEMSAAVILVIHQEITMSIAKYAKKT